MSAENSIFDTKCFPWPSILIPTVFSMLCLFMLIMVYTKLRKIDKKTSVHKARRRLGLRTKKPNNTPEAGNELCSQKMPTSQSANNSLWLREQIQSQMAQHPKAQVNSQTRKGSFSELSSHSGQHSDSDDVNYTTIAFPVHKQGTSTVGGYRD